MLRRYSLLPVLTPLSERVGAPHRKHAAFAKPAGTDSILTAAPPERIAGASDGAPFKSGQKPVEVSIICVKSTDSSHKNSRNCFPVSVLFEVDTNPKMGTWEG